MLICKSDIHQIIKYSYSHHLVFVSIHNLSFAQLSTLLNCYFCLNIQLKSFIVILEDIKVNLLLKIPRDHPSSQQADVHAKLQKSQVVHPTFMSDPVLILCISRDRSTRLHSLHMTFLLFRFHDSYFETMFYPWFSEWDGTCCLWEWAESPPSYNNQGLWQPGASQMLPLQVPL